MNQRHTCNEYETLQHLSDLLAGATAAEELNGLQKHIADCDSCKIELESMAADDAFWKKASSLLGDAKSLSTQAKSGELKHSTISLQVDEAVSYTHLTLPTKA